MEKKIVLREVVNEYVIEVTSQESLFISTGASTKMQLYKWEDILNLHSALGHMIQEIESLKED